jgi:hypothetical protein
MYPVRAGADPKSTAKRGIRISRPKVQKLAGRNEIGFFHPSFDKRKSWGNRGILLDKTGTGDDIIHTMKNVQSIRLIWIALVGGLLILRR